MFQQQVFKNIIFHFCIVILCINQLIYLSYIIIQIMKQQFQQLQNYMATLFDSLDIVDLNVSQQKLVESLIEQNVCYGKKILELSQKFDQLYQMQSEPHLTLLFKLIYPQEEDIPLPQEIFNLLSRQLQHTSKGSLKQSKRSRRKQSQNEMKESIITKKTLTQSKATGKQVLSIRECFEQEQAIIRQIYEKCIKSFQQTDTRIPDFKLSKPSFQFEDITNLSVVKVCIESSKSNLHKIRNLITIITDSAQKWQKNQGNGQNRLLLYLKEIGRREQVFSYAVSKILESFKAVKINLHNSDQEKVLKGVDNLEDLLKKLFQIYPSADLLKEIDRQAPNEPTAEKNISNLKLQQYIQNTKQIQVNIKEKRKDIGADKKQLDLFRFCSKISDLAKKFQSSIKNRRQIDTKQVERLIQQIRQSIQSTNRPKFSTDPQILNIQQYYKQLQLDFATREKQLKTQFQKNLKKNEKVLKSYEQEVEIVKKQIQKFQQKTIKSQKKFELQKLENSKLKSQAETQQITIVKLQQEINSLKQSLKNEQKQSLKMTKLTKSEFQILSKQKEKQDDEHRKLIKTIEQQQDKLQQQRSVYKTKIRILQEKQLEHRDEVTKLKQQLTQMISDNQLLKQKLQEITQLYQDKVNENQQLVQEFKKIQQQLSEKELLYKELAISEAAVHELAENLQQDLQRKKQLLERAQAQRDRFQQQSNKFRELGRLNQQDIEVLRQEIDKVKHAYLQSQQQIEQLRLAYEKLQEQKQDISNQKDRETRTHQKLTQQIEELRQEKQKSDTKIRNLQQEVQTLRKDLHEAQRQQQNSVNQRKQLLKLKKENSELKSTIASQEIQASTLRQEFLQSKQSSDNIMNQLKAMSSKHQLEIESLRIELKNTKESSERDQSNFERQKNLQNQKIAELNELLRERQLLSSKLRLSRQHN